MPSEKQPFYDPVPPTYDEALIGSSRRYDESDWHPPSGFDDRDREGAGAENHSLLRQPGNSGPSSSRAPAGYRAPTVETDDEDSLFGSSDDGEEAQVRRELEEMDIEEPSQSRGSLWGKRIPFSLSLPRWKWSWRPRLPTMPRMRIQLPQRPTEDSAAEPTDDNAEETSTETRRWRMPKMDSMTAIIVFARALAIFIIMGFVYLLLASDIFGGLSQRIGGGFRYNVEDLRAHIQKTVDPMRMRASVMHYSSYAHIAGTEGDFATAMDMESMFSRAGLDAVEIDKYWAYINYPTKDGRAVQLLDGEGKATWSALLEEDEKGEETAGRQTYAFHGLSKSGDVKGPLIYANYGSREDFGKLKDQGVKTKDAIALVRYHGTQADPALKVRAAELAGFAGCLIYSDPADIGFKKGSVAPEGRFIPADGVQRASMALGSLVMGDVLTPGWESKQDLPRMKVSETPGLVGIPSLPLAWRDAQVLLQSLKGHGDKVPQTWAGGVPDVEWWTGDEKSPTVRLLNKQDEVEQQPIWNVYGKIGGTEQSAKKILIGNHRDSWSFGASNPHTGTAIMVELARVFGDLLEKGWRPLRTIEFMSWDAQSQNMVGSTEYVESNLENVRENAYAYINLDAAVTGAQFHAAGSPIFHKTLMHALDRVSDPMHNISVKDAWTRDSGKVEGLGGGGDYVPFQDLAGTASLDLQFRGEEVPFYSSYDDLHLVESVLDPDFVYHGVLAQIVGLLVLDLSDRAVIPFDVVSYGKSLEGWVQDLEKWAKQQQKDHKLDKSANLEFHDLKDAAASITDNARNFAKWELDWDRKLMSSGGWEAQELGVQRWDYNSKLGQFESMLLDLEMGGGTPNRTQFKHTVYGPQLWSTYDVEYFPAIRNAVDAHDWSLARRLLQKTAIVFRDAAKSLSFET
ncbi:transferrin receptor-like dimerization domain-containing protein [Sarocladium implicatum]|nr:transferrin receptor-like dimerization domain-containing protein [Sarocladium implicatum]